MDLSCFIAGARARYARSRAGQPWATLYYAVALDRLPLRLATDIDEEIA